MNRHRLAALCLLLAGTAAAPATQRPFPATGAGMTGQVAMQELKTYARETCRKRFGDGRDAFSLEDVVCDGNPAVRVTFNCRAKARCDGSAETAAPAPQPPTS